MIVCTTTLSVKQDSVQPFERLLTRLVDDVLANEPGTPVFQLLRSQRDPLTYFVVEQYTDQAALDVHHGTDYLRTTVPEMLTYLSAPPVLESFDPVS